jgi:hypothetical protein
MRAGLLEDAPETYYGTDHYVDYPVVLVRMSRIRTEQLRDLLGHPAVCSKSRTRLKSRVPLRLALRDHLPHLEPETRRRVR